MQFAIVSLDFGRLIYSESLALSDPHIQVVFLDPDQVSHA